MSLKAIWAQSRNGVIGRDGAMPWHLPEDLRHFARLTRGHRVVMGRRTWDSLPAANRPLPGRDNLVLSRDPAFVPDGATRLCSFDEVHLWSAEHDVWVIGGAEIYRALLPLCSEAHVTMIDIEVEGDTRAPDVAAVMDLARREPPSGALVSVTGLAYWHTTWVRRASPAG